MVDPYDLVVIGSGPAGQAVVYECRSSGMRIALVEARELGGTCPLRGCEPKKVLVGAGEVVGRARDMAGNGVQALVTIRWPELIRFKRSFTGPIPEEMEKRLSGWGIHIIRGRASFTGLNEIRVGEKILTGRHIVIAAGAVPQPLNIPGEEHVAVSDWFLELENIPGSVVFIGGGYISFEFAHLAARAGSRTTILHRSARPLKNFDRDLVQMLIQASREIGVEVHLNMPVRSVEKTKEGYLVHAGENGDRRFSAGLVVHGAGRVPDLQGLELDKAEVKFSSRGIIVNRSLQSISNPRVYAAGDAADTPFFLTPPANLEGRAVGRAILSGEGEGVDYRGVPSVVFTVPPLATVGLSEEELERTGVEYEKKFADTSSWFETRRIGLAHSGVKILLEKKSGKVLGAHLLGNHAEEVINIFSLAIRRGMTLRELTGVPWSYPSSVSEIGYLAD